MGHSLTEFYNACCVLKMPKIMIIYVTKKARIKRCLINDQLSPFFRCLIYYQWSHFIFLHQNKMRYIVCWTIALIISSIQMTIQLWGTVGIKEQNINYISHHKFQNGVQFINQVCQSTSCMKRVGVFPNGILVELLNERKIPHCQPLTKKVMKCLPDQ